MELRDSFERLDALRKRIGGVQKSTSFDEPIAPLRDIEREPKTGVVLIKMTFDQLAPT